MIKIFQNIFGDEKKAGIKRGNCMQAVYASMMELSLNNVPHFVSYPDDEWVDVWVDFMREHGYEYEGSLINKPHLYPDNKVDLEFISKYNGINGYFEAIVYSPNYFNEELFKKDPTAKQTLHAVVVDKNLNIVHDPNPNYRNINKYPLSDEIGYNGILSVIIFEKYN